MFVQFFCIGDAPLWTALESEQEEIASVLVRHGVDTDCWNLTGPDGCLQTLLHRAIDENRESAAIFLIRSRCDLDSPRQPGPNGEGIIENYHKSWIYLKLWFPLKEVMMQRTKHRHCTYAVNGV